MHRRKFLTLLGLGAAGTVAVPPVRRIWQVATQLERPPAVAQLRAHVLTNPTGGINWIDPPVVTADPVNAPVLLLYGGAARGGKGWISASYLEHMRDAFTVVRDPADTRSTFTVSVAQPKADLQDFPDPATLQACGINYTVIS